VTCDKCHREYENPTEGYDGLCRECAIKTAPHEVAIADAILTETRSAINSLEKASKTERLEIAEGFRIAARLQFNRVRSLALTASRSLKRRDT
jgi:hypothetical protein